MGRNGDMLQQIATCYQILEGIHKVQLTGRTCPQQLRLYKESQHKFHAVYNTHCDQLCLWYGSLPVNDHTSQEMFIIHFACMHSTWLTTGSSHTDIHGSINICVSHILKHSSNCLVHQICQIRQLSMHYIHSYHSVVL